MDLTIYPGKLRLYAVALYEALKDRLDSRRRWGLKDYSFHYKGYFVYWTGWKLAQASFNIVGQWVAIPEKAPYYGFYASLPGGEGRFLIGETFDIEQKPGQEPLTYEDKRRGWLGIHPFMYLRRQECWLRLKAQIEANPVKVQSSAYRREQEQRKKKFMTAIRKSA